MDNPSFLRRNKLIFEYFFRLKKKRLINNFTLKKFSWACIFKLYKNILFSERLDGYIGTTLGHVIK